MQDRGCKSGRNLRRDSNGGPWNQPVPRALIDHDSRWNAPPDPRILMPFKIWITAFREIDSIPNPFRGLGNGEPMIVSHHT